jgi:16S rRNA (cytosine967-C5)-methyltransferase
LATKILVYSVKIGLLIRKIGTISLICNDLPEDKMKEASRVQAAIEALNEILADKYPADNILDKYFKDRRYIGAKDRRFIAELVWQVIRKRLHLKEKLGGTVSARLFVALTLGDVDLELLFNGEEYAPEKLSSEEQKQLKTAANFNDFSEEAIYECPQWLADKINDYKLLDMLNTTAPVDMRVNFTSREQAIARLKKEGLFFAPTPLSPIGLRSYERINLNNCMSYQDGEVEVMDEGSQVISLLCRVKSFHKIIDYCAGAGGKSLALGAMLNNEGIVWAHDISQERISRIKKRAERLDVTNIKIIQNVTDKDYDRFILDCPCSGSGTWRRSPDAKFRLTPARLNEICQTQAELLEFGARHTASGGRLIYMTCSVLAEENEQQIEHFLKNHPEYAPLDHRELWKNTFDLSVYPFDSDKWLKFSPLNTGTDGFFFCALQNNAQ